MEQRTEHIYTAQQCHTQTQNTPLDFISYGPYREYRSVDIYGGRMQIQFRQLALKSPHKGPGGVGGRKNSGAHPIL